MKRGFFWIGLFFLAVLSARGTDETLNLKLDRAQEITVGSNKITFDGKVEDGFMNFGAKGYAVPAAGLTGEKGTILAQLIFDRSHPEVKGARALISLRTASRLKIEIYTFAANDRKCMFAFSDQTNNIYSSTPKTMKPGTPFFAAVTWDGERVRFYADGKLLEERKQTVPVKNIRNLNIGPYSDGWYKLPPWGDETRIGLLKVWNRALTPGEIMKECGVNTNTAPEQYPARLSIPEVATPPAMDGKLDDKAWNQAASLIGLADLRGNPFKGWRLPPNTAQYAWDKNNLYLGFTTLFPRDAAIRMGNNRKSGSKAEEAWGYESFEFRIKVGKEIYRFAGNVAGGSSSSKLSDSNWNGEWDYATSLSHRIDDRKLWQGEVAIPWKTLGLSAPPKDGVSINFSRSWLLVGCECLSSSAWNGNYLDDKVFQQASCERVPSLQLLEQNTPEFGSLVQKLALYSPLPADVTYEVSGAAMDGSIPATVLFSKDFRIPADTQKIETVTIPIRQTCYDALLFTFRQGKKILMRQLLPFRLNEEFFTVSPRFLQGKLLVNVKRFMILEKFGKDAPFQLTLKDEKGKTIASEPLGDRESFMVPFENGNPAGDYTMELTGKSGKILYQTKFHFPGIGEWSKITFDNRIIPPFTPLETRKTDNGLTVSMWGRTYEWKNSLFPAAIVSQKEPLLDGPVTLMADGKPLAGAKVRMDKADPHRAELTTTYDGTDCSVVNNTWIEYDGVSYCRVTLKAKQPLKNLRLRIPIPGELARYLHTSSESVSWGSRLTEKLQDGKRSFHFFPVVWIGSEDKGLCFFTETREGWKNRSQEVNAILKNKREAVYEISLADALTPGETFSFEFGLLASPVRPLPKNYPCNFFTWAFCTPMNRPEGTIDLVLGYGGNNLGGTFGDIPGFKTNPRNAVVLQQVAQAKKFKTRFIPYAIDRYLTDEYPEVAAFKEEWKMVPEHILDYNDNGRKHFIYDCCPRSGANAFFMYKFKNMLDFFKMDGIYLDFGTVSACSNAEHGCNNRSPLLAQREFYRRLCLTQLDAGIKDPVVMLHNTDTVQLPTMTFASHLFNGEQIRQASSTIMHNGKDILDTYDVTMFASELNSLPFGLTNSDYQSNDVLMPEYGGGKEDPELYKFRITKAFLAGALPHNTLPSGCRCHYGIFDKLLRVYNQFGVPQSEFFGYWKHPAEVIRGKDIFVSVYKQPGGKKALAVISHIGKGHEKQTLEIDFDAKKLGMNPFSKATDCMTAPDPDYAWLEEQRRKERVDPGRAPLKLGNFGSSIQSCSDGKLKMTLDFHSFAIVELE